MFHSFIHIESTDSMNADSMIKLTKFANYLTIPIQVGKCAYYSSIILTKIESLLCLKLCWHNLLGPTPLPLPRCMNLPHWVVGLVCSVIERMLFHEEGRMIATHAAVYPFLIKYCDPITSKFSDAIVSWAGLPCSTGVRTWKSLTPASLLTLYFQTSYIQIFIFLRQTLFATTEGAECWEVWSLY